MPTRLRMAMSGACAAHDEVSRSTTRGRRHASHLPVWRGELIRCPRSRRLADAPRAPRAGCVSIDNVAAHLLERTAEPPPAGHVFTLRAELEGRRLAPVLEQLIVRWEGQG